MRATVGNSPHDRKKFWRPIMASNKLMQYVYFMQFS